MAGAVKSVACRRRGDLLKGPSQLYVDAKGTPYLFHGVAAGHGTSARSVGADLYRLKTGLDKLDVLLIEAFGTALETYHYKYKVTMPPEGGLIVDTTLVPPKHPDGCCEDLPRHQRFRLGP